MSEDKKDIKIEYILLRVLDQDGGIVQYKIKQNVPLKKLLISYCKRTGLDMPSSIFRAEGEAIGDDSTALSLQLEDGDTIQLFLPQTSGGFVAV